MTVVEADSAARLCRNIAPCFSFSMTVSQTSEAPVRPLAACGAPTCRPRPVLPMVTAGHVHTKTAPDDDVALPVVSRHGARS
jgi:hypothetical protein